MAGFNIFEFLAPHDPVEVGIRTKDPIIQALIRALLAEGSTQRARTMRLATLHSRPRVGAEADLPIAFSNTALGAYWPAFNLALISPERIRSYANRYGRTPDAYRELLLSTFGHELGHTLQPPSKQSETFADYLGGFLSPEEDVRYFRGDYGRLYRQLLTDLLQGGQRK